MKKLKFLISLRAEDTNYQKQNAIAAQETAARLDVDVQILYAGNDAITQSEDILKAIRSSVNFRPDGIICTPVGTTLLRVAREAAVAGIAWAIVNREWDYPEELRQSSQIPIFSVTVDHREIGSIQGRQIGALLPEGGTVLCVVGPTGHPIRDQRLTGMEEAKPPNVELRTIITDWTLDGTNKAASRWLQSKAPYESKVALVAGQNDDIAMGARRALEDHTNDDQWKRWKSLPYIGCDYLPGTGQEWVRRGLLKASIINPPPAGLALEMMVKAIRTNENPPEKATVTPVSYPALEDLRPNRERDSASRHSTDLRKIGSGRRERFSC